MQALIPTVFPCYAPADRALAAAIAGFLERCGDVRVFLDEGQLAAGPDLAGPDLASNLANNLAAKAREARMADVVLLLFTRHSLPRPWPRSLWEAPLITEPRDEGARLAFARCDDCLPPRVLVPLFDLQGLPVQTLRRLKRWIRNPATAALESRPALEPLAAALADRPGCETVATPAEAAKFADAFAADFEAVLHLDCPGRSLAALAGDLTAQLGMRLEGPLEDNLSRLRDFCAHRRFLLILEGGTAPPLQSLIPGGRTSTLITHTAVDPLREAQTTLARAETAPPLQSLIQDGRTSTSITHTAVDPLREAQAGTAPPLQSLIQDGRTSTLITRTADDPATTVDPLREAQAETAPPLQSLIQDGRTSTLITRTADDPATAVDPLREAQTTLARAETADWTTVCNAAKLGRRIANEQGRLAECYELMHQWREAALKNQDRAALEESAREMVWILQRWDRFEEAARLEYERAVHYDDQMAFAW